MHDAAEAYLADLGGPIKRVFHVHHSGPEGDRVESFSDAEDRLLEVIAAGLGFEAIDYAAVREADMRLLMTEARDVMGGQVVNWEVEEAALEERIVPVSWEEAERMFLERWEELGDQGSARS
jgi:hypothetical protein